MNLSDSQVVFKFLGGSRLYGTAVDSSDYDFKTVYAHNLDGLILSKSDTFRTKDPDNNTESEFFSLRKMASMFCQNQTIAIEMLFVPQQNICKTSPIWEELMENKDKIISKHILPFVGYAKNQANIYSVKGNKLEFLERLAEQLSIWSCDNFEKREDGVKVIPKFIDWVMTHEMFQPEVELGYLTIETRKNNTSSIRMLGVLNSFYEETLPLGQWISRIVRQISEYGDRATIARNNKGHDTKATYHAVRIISEAIELVSTGKLKFPRYEVNTLLDIRNNKISYNEAAGMIQTLVTDLDKALAISTLRSEPDKAWIDSWALRNQRWFIEQELEIISRINHD